MRMTHFTWNQDEISLISIANEPSENRQTPVFDKISISLPFSQLEWGIKLLISLICIPSKPESASQANLWACVWIMWSNQKRRIQAMVIKSDLMLSKMPPCVYVRVDYRVNRTLGKEKDSKKIWECEGRRKAGKNEERLKKIPKSKQTNKTGRKTFLFSVQRD